MSIIEEWRPVVGYEGLYEVSDQGRVRSLDRTCHDKNGLAKKFKGKILKNIKKVNTYGQYYVVRLPRKANDGHFNAYVAHLVLEAFICLRPKGMECCHCDGNSLNNCVSNLRWDTPAENTKDKYLHGNILWGTRNHQAKLNEQQVREIRSKYRFYSSRASNAKQLSQEYGVTTGTITRIARGDAWSYLDQPSCHTEQNIFPFL
jgi:hypothetical protein